MVGKKHLHKIAMIVALLSLPITSSAVTIGAGPTPLEFENVARGGYSEKILTVSNPQDENLTGVVTASGPIRDWMTYTPDTFVVPASSELKIQVSVTPPDNIVNGAYVGKTIIHVAPSSEVEPGTLPTGAGTIIDTTVEITGVKIWGYFLKSVTVRDTEVTQPILLDIIIENNGNVAASPNITIDILSYEDKKILSQGHYYKETILAGKTHPTVLQIPSTGLKAGRYWAEVSMDGVRRQLISFDLLEQGALTLRGVLRNISAGKSWVQEGESLKVEGVFSNTGKMDFPDAKLKCEAYTLDKKSGEQKLKQTFESDTLRVPVGKDIVLTTYFTPKDGGEHTISCYMVYAGKTTTKVSTEVNVIPKQKNYIFYYATVTIVLLAGLYYIKRRPKDGQTASMEQFWGDHLKIRK